MHTNLTRFFRVLVIAAMSSLTLFSCSCGDDDDPPPAPELNNVWGEATWGTNEWEK